MASVSQALEESGLDPSRLTLEVTETVIMNDVPRSIQVLTALRKVEPQDSDRRLRHGLLLARCTALPPGRHTEDRQVVRDRSGPRPGVIGPHSPHVATCGRLPSSHHGRGGRGGRAARDSAQVRLRLSTGLPFRQASALADILNLLTSGLQQPEAAPLPPALDPRTRALVSTYPERR